MTYIEKQVGCFTAKDPYIQFDEDHQKSYVYAQCAIPRDYTHAANIIERKGGTKVSVELLVNACSYNAKEKYLELSDIEVAGCCLLGEDVGEGMVGSKLQLEDFAYSEPEPTINFSEDQMNSLINSFKVFREVYLLTGDYPLGRLYMLQHFMNNTFRSFDYQKLSAAAVIMAIVMVVLIALLFKIEDWFGKDVEG